MITTKDQENLSALSLTTKSPSDERFTERVTLHSFEIDALVKIIKMDVSPGSFEETFRKSLIQKLTANRQQLP